jgi:hypothetical protein
MKWTITKKINEKFEFQSCHYFLDVSLLYLLKKRDVWADVILEELICVWCENVRRLEKEILEEKQVSWNYLLVSQLRCWSVFVLRCSFRYIFFGSIQLFLRFTTILSTLPMTSDHHPLTNNRDTDQNRIKSFPRQTCATTQSILLQTFAVLLN